jgi:hypothetical protein
MKDIKAMANGVLKLTDELHHLSPVDKRFSEVLTQLIEAQAALDAVRTEVEDLNAAKYLLNKHGYAFKIFTPEDVERLLQAAEDNDGAGRDIANIVKHVVEGDDWQTMADVTAEDESNLYAIIDGTRHDHPEWFGTAD